MELLGLLSDFKKIVQYLPDVAALYYPFFLKFKYCCKIQSTKNAIKFSVVILFVFQIILKGGKVSRLWLDNILDNEMFFYWN
jgi:hypothetical protein